MPSGSACRSLIAPSPKPWPAGPASVIRHPLPYLRSKHAAPRDTATRERKSLNGLWRFALDAAGAGRGQGWWEGLPAAAREMPVPASYNDVFPEPDVHDHVYSFFRKMSQAVSASLVGYALAVGSFAPKAPAQPHSALTAIKAVMGLAPAMPRR